MEEDTKQVNTQKKASVDAEPEDSELVNIDKIFSESKGVGYYRRYGMHFAVAVVILAMFFCLITYFSLQEKFSYYRNALETVYNDEGEEVTVPVWDSVKCKPHILPISGYIKKKPNEKSSTASLRYMRECIKVDTGSLAALNPITAGSAVVSVTLNTFSSVLSSLRDNVERMLLSMVKNAKKVNRTTALHRYNIIEEIQKSIDARINESVIQLGKEINGGKNEKGEVVIKSLKQVVKDKKAKKEREERDERLRKEQERLAALANRSPSIPKQENNDFNPFADIDINIPDITKKVNNTISRLGLS